MSVSARLAVSLALLLAPCLRAGVEEEIQALEESWGKAIVAKDVATVERLLAPKVVYTHASGAVETKQLYLERLKGGKQRYDSYTREKCQFVAYSNSAVAHCTIRVTGKNDSGNFNDHVLLTHHWVKQNGAWQIASHHTTRIP